MKNFFKSLVARFNDWRQHRKMLACIRRAAAIVRNSKLEYPSCEGAICGWPTTGASGNGNISAAQYFANGNATGILWGTNNFLNITGFFTVTKISQKTMMAADENLPNGDGQTAGKVQIIDGSSWEIEVRDDVSQVTSALTVGQRLLIPDGGGLVPGGARGATYSAIIKDNSWDTAPKTPAGRTLSVEKFVLIA